MKPFKKKEVIEEKRSGRGKLDRKTLAVRLDKDVFIKLENTDEKWLQNLSVNARGAAIIKDYFEDFAGGE